MKKLIILLLMSASMKCLAQCPYDTCISITGENTKKIFDQKSTTAFRHDMPIKDTIMNEIATAFAEHQIGDTEGAVVMYPSSIQIHWKENKDDFYSKVIVLDNSGYLKRILCYGIDIQTGATTNITGLRYDTSSIDGNYSSVAAAVEEGKRFLESFKNSLPVK